MNRVERFSIAVVLAVFAVLCLIGPLTAAIHNPTLFLTDPY